MLTGCGRPQGRGGPCGRLWTGEGAKTWFFVDVINGWPHRETWVWNAEKGIGYIACIRFRHSVFLLCKSMHKFRYHVTLYLFDNILPLALQKCCSISGNIDYFFKFMFCTSMQLHKKCPYMLRLRNWSRSHFIFMAASWLVKGLLFFCFYICVCLYSFY